MLNDIIIPVKKKYFNASLEIETKCLMKEAGELSALHASGRGAHVQGKTMIIIQMNLVLVSSSKFTKGFIHIGGLILRSCLNCHFSHKTSE